MTLRALDRDGASDNDAVGAGLDDIGLRRLASDRVGGPLGP